MNELSIHHFHSPHVDVSSHQTTLRVLDVGFCGLGQEGGQYLLGVLQQNVREFARLTACVNTH